MPASWPTGSSITAAMAAATLPTVPANTVVRFPQGTDNRAAVSPTPWPNASSIIAAMQRAAGLPGR